MCLPRPARREARVAGEEGLSEGAVRMGGKLVGAALGMLLTTAGEPGPRSMRLSSVASLRTWLKRSDEICCSSPLMQELKGGFRGLWLLRGNRNPFEGS